MSNRQQKKIEEKQMQQHLENEYGQVHANETTSLLKVKQDFLHFVENKFDRQNRIFWLETFAMFIFIYASTCSKFTTGVDLAFFVGIMMAIPICARQTGANLNPAVSYSMALKNDSPSTYSLFWIYVKAQIVGAILSMIVTLVLNDVHRSPLYPQIGSLSQILRMILSQMIGVFTLIFFVLYVTGPQSFIQNNGAKYFYISVFVYIGRKFAAVSSNQINFALTLSQAFVGIPECNFKGFHFLFIWFIGDALGVFLAAQFYNYILQPTAAHLHQRHKLKQMAKKQQESSIQLKNMNKP